MRLTFSTNKLEKQLSTPSNVKKAFGVNAKRVQQRLDDIEASPSLAVLQKIPAANCHPLKGQRQGEWSLDISANHRMIFTIDHDPIPRKENGEVETVLVTDIKVIETTDYH